jgi:hypothetical protein
LRAPCGIRVAVFTLLFVPCLAIAQESQLSLGKRSAIAKTLVEVTKVRNRIAATRHRFQWSGDDTELQRGSLGTYRESWDEHAKTSSVRLSVESPRKADGLIEPIVDAKVVLDTRGNVLGYAVMQRREPFTKKDIDAHYDITIVRGRGRNRTVERSTRTWSQDPDSDHIDRFTVHAQPDAPQSKDIALGLQVGVRRGMLQRFAATVGATSFHGWYVRNVSRKGDDDPYGGEFELKFKNALARTVRGGGRIKFNLTGLDVKGALAGRKSITNWELREVLGNPKYRAVTDYYRQDALGNVTRVGKDELRRLGLGPDLPPPRQSASAITGV